MPCLLPSVPECTLMLSFTDSNNYLSLFKPAFAWASILLS